MCSTVFTGEVMSAREEIILVTVSTCMGTKRL